jgi:ABC-type sulfate transport system permease component
MLRNWKLSMVFLFLSGLVLLFIVAPLAGMFLKTSLPQYANTVSDPVLCAASGLPF